MKYTGKGAFVYGIPARDLTAAEVEQWGKEFLSKTGLYEQQHTDKDETKTKAKKGKSGN